MFVVAALRANTDGVVEATRTATPAADEICC
jgi:hypothetical protein